MNRTRAGYPKRVLSLWLSLLLAGPASIGLAKGQEQSPVRKLNIVIVEGDGAINNIKQRTSRAPIVQVTDENNKPVAGAAVVFMLPARGASGNFSSTGSRILSVTTGPDGKATAAGLQPNNVAGEVKINVTASHQGQTATVTVTQTNALTGAAGAGAAGAGAGASGGISGTMIGVIVGVVAAGAIGGVVAATRGGSSGGSATGPTGPTRIQVGIGPGPVTIGAPR